MSGIEKKLKNTGGDLGSQSQAISIEEGGSQKTTYSFKIDKRRKRRVELLASIHTQLANAYQEENSGPRKLTKAKITKALEWDKAALSRKLSENANLTLFTISDLCYSMDRKPVAFIVRPEHEMLIRRIAGMICGGGLEDSGSQPRTHTSSINWPSDESDDFNNSLMKAFASMSLIIWSNGSSDHPLVRAGTASKDNLEKAAITVVVNKDVQPLESDLVHG